jgi:hypothetical protein
MQTLKIFVLIGIAPLLLSVTRPSLFGVEWSIERHTLLSYIPASQGSAESWRLRRVKGNGEVVTLLLAVLPLEQNRTFIEHVDRVGATSTVYSPGFCKHALVVVNGNFFVDENNTKKPLGLLKVSGRTITKTSPRKTGGFLVVDASGRIKILPKLQREQAEIARDALESTPILILNGRDDMRGDQRDKFDRVAVGNSQNGDAIIIGAYAKNQQTISLAEFSKFALAALKNKEIEPDGLLAMDGGPSAHIWFPKRNALYGYRGTAYLPSAVCVKPK